MHLPLLPLQLIPAHSETNALRLYDMQRLQCLPNLSILLLPLSFLSFLALQLGEVLMPTLRRGDAFPAQPKILRVQLRGCSRRTRGREFTTRSSIVRGEIDMDNGMCGIVDYGEEIEGVGVEVRVRGEACVHEALLQALGLGEAVVVSRWGVFGLVEGK